MSINYITPITDRTLTDVVSKTPKGFFNVSDFARINNNSEFVARFLAFAKLYPYAYNDEENGFFQLYINPGIASIPGVASSSVPTDLVNNIEGLRSFLGAPTTVIPVVYQNRYYTTFTYADVNTWEYLLDRILTVGRAYYEYQVFCGVSNVGQQRFYQARWRNPWVGAATSPVRMLRSGLAVAGSNLTRGNLFRRY